MMATQRNGLWGFIALLLALAFLRSLAPEHTERAVRGLMTSSGPSKTRGSESETERKELQDMRDELKRERLALERLKKDLEHKSKEVEEMGTSSDAANEEGLESAEDISTTLSEADPDAYTNEQPAPNTENEGELSNAAASGGTDGEEALVDTDSPSEVDEEETRFALSEGECPTIVAPESAKSGLGTQVEHIWSSLSVTLAIQNACVVLPPVIADDGQENFRSIPFHEVFDLEELERTGLRVVPLGACQAHGVIVVFDDRGAETAIVKNFAAFVQESHPKLAEETTLVHAHSEGHRFENASVVNGDVTVVGRYIAERKPDEEGRHCIGFGRMRAEVAVNPDVLEHFRSAPGIAEFVSSKYPHANETMFVKLRWNRAHCEHARTEDGTVCIFGDNVASVEEYVRSIAYTAEKADASGIYLSAPSSIPDDISAYIANHLKVLDPVLLDVDGDFFTANVIERELAIRSKVFVPDGGAWGDTVQLSRKALKPDVYTEGFNSMNMLQLWKDAGWPADSEFLILTDMDEKSGSRTEALTSNDNGIADQIDPSSNSEEEERVKLETASSSSEPSDNTVRDAGSELQERAGELDIEQHGEAQSGNGVDTFQDVVHGGAVAAQQPSSEETNEGGLQGGQTADDEQHPDVYVFPEGYTPVEDSDEHLFVNAEGRRVPPLVPTGEVMRAAGATAAVVAAEADIQSEVIGTEAPHEQVHAEHSESQSIHGLPAEAGRAEGVIPPGTARAPTEAPEARAGESSAGVVLQPEAVAAG